MSIKTVTRLNELVLGEQLMVDGRTMRFYHTFGEHSSIKPVAIINNRENIEFYTIFFNGHDWSQKNNKPDSVMTPHDENYSMFMELWTMGKIKLLKIGESPP